MVAVAWFRTSRCGKELSSYLPKPMVIKDGEFYKYDNNIENSIGRVKPFYGNFGIYLRAYTYIRTMGAEGLKSFRGCCAEC